MATRKYSDAEVAAILSRAADLSMTHAAQATSLAELETIGAEAGLDPELVRKAAAELGRGAHRGVASEVETTAWEKSFGPARLLYETVVPGELPEDAQGELLDLVQQRLSLPGVWNRTSSSFSWSLAAGQNGGRTITIHLSSRNGETRIKVEETLGQLAASVYLGLGVGGGLSCLTPGLSALGFFVGGPIGAVVGGTLGAGVSAFGCRALHRRLAAKRAAQLSALYEELVDETAQAAVVDTKVESALDAAKRRQGLAAAPDADGAPELAEVGPVENIDENVEENVDKRGA